MTNDKFSVYQFFEDNSYEQVRTNVFLNEAVKAAKHHTNSVAARMGMVQRVIVTDSGDCVVFEWRFGFGVVFPKIHDS